MAERDFFGTPTDEEPIDLDRIYHGITRDPVDHPERDLLHIAIKAETKCKTCGGRYSADCFTVLPDCCDTCATELYPGIAAIFRANDPIIERLTEVQALVGRVHGGYLCRK